MLKSVKEILQSVKKSLVFLVWIPKKLEKDEKALVESLRGKESFKPNPTKEDRNFFDKLKDLFD